MAVPNNTVQLAAIPRFIHPRRVCRRCDRRSVELRRSRRCVPPLIRQAVPARGNAYAHKLAVARRRTDGLAGDPKGHYYRYFAAVDLITAIRCQTAYNRHALGFGRDRAIRAHRGHGSIGALPCYRLVRGVGGIDRRLQPLHIAAWQRDGLAVDADLSDGTLHRHCAGGSIAAVCRLAGDGRRAVPDGGDLAARDCGYSGVAARPGDVLIRGVRGRDRRGQRRGSTGVQRERCPGKGYARDVDACHAEGVAERLAAAFVVDDHLIGIIANWEVREVHIVVEVAISDVHGFVVVRIDGGHRAEHRIRAGFDCAHKIADVGGTVYLAIQLHIAPIGDGGSRLRPAVDGDRG